MKTRILLIIGAIAASAALAASAVSTPRIQSVAPNAIARSANPITITIQGEDFQPGLTLEVTTPAGAKTPIGGNAIESRTLTSFRANVTFNERGRYELVVMNADGGVSSPFAIDVKDRAADGPTIDRINPGETTKKPEQQTFMVEGKNFASGLTVVVTDPTGARRLRSRGAEDRGDVVRADVHADDERRLLRRHHEPRRRHVERREDFGQVAAAGSGLRAGCSLLPAACYVYFFSTIALSRARSACMPERSGASIIDAGRKPSLSVSPLLRMTTFDPAPCRTI